ncbi:hypothetical protein VN97_g12272 [Penicillium thymicola]|uniref:Uncharacterized protein n=1 Tax=Penicillium thymicola TaxID=293382 RepID=A0AAI9T6N0_PENTH|nr:hypothetical protein VN97_g12272 [Penicillium thymicola]
MAPLTKRQKKNRKDRKRRARRAAEAAAEAAANTPPPSAEEVSRLWAIAYSALNKAAAATVRRAAADAAAPGSGGGDLGGPDRDGGQGASQGTTEQAVTEPLPGGSTDLAPASPIPSSPPYSPSYSPPTFGPVRLPLSVFSLSQVATSLRFKRFASCTG